MSFVGPCSARTTMAILLFIALALAYAHRAVLSAVIVPLSREMGYTSSDQGVVLSAFFVGYIFPQMIGGYLATRFGGHRVLLCGIMTSSLAMGLCVLAAPHLPALVAARALVGLGQGVVLPSVHALLAKWAPPHERASAVGAVWSGLFIGTSIALPISGVLGACTAEASLSCGWRAAFQWSALCGVVWCLAWTVMGSSEPKTHPWCSAEEAALIKGVAGTAASAQGTTTIDEDNDDGDDDRDGGNSATSSDARTRPVDIGWHAWGRIVRNPAVWAVIVLHTTHNTLFYTLLAWIPAFLLLQLQIDVHAAAISAIAPYFACFLASAAGGAFADAAIRRGTSVLTVRRVVTTISELLPALSLVALSYTRDPTIALALLTVSVGLSGASSAGFAVNYIDLAPEQAGALLGLGNTIATLPGIIAPSLVGWAVDPPNDTASSWQRVFIVIAAVSVIGWTIFMLAGRASPQRDLGSYVVDGAPMVQAASSEPGAGAPSQNGVAQRNGSVGAVRGTSRRGSPS